MREFSKIYLDYIATLDSAKVAKYKEGEYGHRMSGTGSCYKKHIFNEKVSEKEIEIEEQEPNAVLELGNILHTDFQKAMIMEQYLLPDHIRIHQEMEVSFAVSSESKNTVIYIKGHLDTMAVNDKKKTITIYDYKTVGAFKWQKMFGLIKNREAGSDYNYRMQLGSYGAAIRYDYPGYEIILKLIYYKKDNSMIKEVIVEPFYMDAAVEYWEGLAQLMEDFPNHEEIIPGMMINVPVQSKWECNTKYCPFSGTICNSPFTK